MLVWAAVSWTGRLRLTCAQTDAGGVTKLVATDGSANFTGCRIDKAGSNYRLVAQTSPYLTPIETNAFTITSGVATKLTFLQEPSSGTAGVALPISRLVVNQASSLTAGGSLTNGFAPTTTLGCGSWGGNSISENLDYKHLMNVSRIGKVIANKKVPTDEEIFA